MPHPESPGAGFASTHWSLVAHAAADAPTAHAALLTLCLRYWYPVYAYLRRSGHAAQHAHDLTRAFFQALLRGERVQADAARHGRFRQFLLAELHRFLARDPPPGTPGDALAGPALETLEARLRTDAGTALSPERLLHRGFAVEILGAARLQLQREAREAGRLAMFDALQPYLGREPGAGDYDSVARQLGMQPMVVAIAVRRLRQRFRELVDHELGQTLAHGEDAQQEREALLQALGNDGG
jgi:hypothetical protein